MARVIYPKRRKQWDILGGVNDAFTANEVAAGAALPFTLASTIIRMIGEYVLAPGGTAVTTGDIADVTVAIGIVSTDAFAAGSAALPDPGDDTDYPWLYNKSHPFIFGGTSEDPNSAAASVRVAFDIKSMRKVKPKESLVSVFQYVDVAGTPPIDINMAFTRVLLALP